MHNFESFSEGWCFPSFIRGCRDDFLDFLGDVSKFVLFGTESKFGADHVRVSVLTPKRVDDRFSHFSDSALTDIFGLEVFVDAVSRTNLVADLQCGPKRSIFLDEINNLMTHRA